MFGLLVHPDRAKHIVTFALHLSYQLWIFQDVSTELGKVGVLTAGTGVDFRVAVWDTFAVTAKAELPPGTCGFILK